MRTEKHPYEVLFRFNEDGTLAGAHVQWRVRLFDDDDTYLGETITHAEKVEAAGQKGFPLDQIMDKTLEASIASFDAKSAELEEVRFQLESAQEELRALRSPVVRAKR